MLSTPQLFPPLAPPQLTLKIPNWGDSGCSQMASTLCVTNWGNFPPTDTTSAGLPLLPTASEKAKSSFETQQRYGNVFKTPGKPQGSLLQHSPNSR